MSNNPVPPAGDVEVPQRMSPKLCTVGDKDVWNHKEVHGWNSCHDKFLPVFTRLTAERDGLQAAADKAMRSVVELATAMTRDVPDLSPKFELFETIWGIVGQIDNMYAGMRCERDALQSELTKALEELRLEKLVGASKHQQAEDFKALSWERGQELTKARECLKDLGVDWPQVSDLYQSAPAAKCDSCGGNIYQETPSPTCEACTFNGKDEDSPAAKGGD